MMHQCTYTENGVRCDQPATHYCVATFEEPYVWNITDKPGQVENLDGFKMTGKQLDDDGKIVTDANGIPVMVPTMHVLEFCLADAEIVCAQRNMRFPAAAGV